VLFLFEIHWVAEGMEKKTSGGGEGNFPESKGEVKNKIRSKG